jgi:exodeoxyribonuclease X
MKAIIFDTETTGRESSTVIEAAHMYVHLDGGTLVRALPPYLQRFDPAPIQIEWGALATHHILPHELEHMPASADFQIPDDVKFIIGHNVDFDWTVAGSPDVQRICTLALSRWLWPDLDAHNQSALYYWIKQDDLAGAREVLRNAHSAAVDIQICADILLYEIATIRQRGYVCDTWAQLWLLSEKARIPTVMGFGKHKGEKIADIPASYKSWMLKQEEVDPYLRIALQGGVMK